MGQPDVEDSSLEDSFPRWLNIVPNLQVKLAMIETSSSALSSTDRVVMSRLSHSWSPGNSWWLRIFTVTRLPEILKVGTVPTFWISELLLIRSQPTVSMANEQEVKFVPIYVTEICGIIRCCINLALSGWYLLSWTWRRTSAHVGSSQRANYQYHLQLNIHQSSWAVCQSSFLVSLGISDSAGGVKPQKIVSLTHSKSLHGTNSCFTSLQLLQKLSIVSCQLKFTSTYISVWLDCKYKHLTIFLCSVIEVDHSQSSDNTKIMIKK